MADDLIKKAIRDLQTEVDRAVKTELETSVVPEAKARCPLGPHHHHLRDAIHIEEEPEGFYIVGGDKKAWYGHLVEFGTALRRTRDRPDRKGHSTGAMPAHPFLTPAFEANREAIIKAAEAAVKKACSR